MIFQYTHCIERRLGWNTLRGDYDWEMVIPQSTEYYAQMSADWLGTRHPGETYRARRIRPLKVEGETSDLANVPSSEG